jgi:hypothetical protein
VSRMTAVRLASTPSSVAMSPATGDEVQVEELADELLEPSGTSSAATTLALSRQTHGGGSTGSTSASG